MSVTHDARPASASPAAEGIQGRSLTRIALDRLRHDRTFVLSVSILAFIVLVALFAPVICGWIGVDPYSFNPDTVDPEQAGRPLGPWGGASWQHPFGVEWGTGRDIFARLVYGLRVSLLIATCATVITTIIGTTVGIISGYSKGWVDSSLGRFMDLILAFPFLLIVLSLSGALTDRITSLGVPAGNASRITYLIVIFSIFGWPFLSRIVRGQVLSLREREFVESAIAMGAGTPRILFREVLPNLWAPILVYATLVLPSYIGAEAALSFLGVGILPPEPSFGAMLSDSIKYFTLIPSYLFIPGTLLTIVVIAFNLAGDSIRDAIDPQAGRQ